MVFQRLAVGAVGAFRFGISLAVPAPMWAVGGFGEGGQADDRLLFVELHRFGTFDWSSVGRPRPFLVPDEAVSAIGDPTATKAI